MYSTGEEGFYEMYLNDLLPKEAAIALAAVLVTSLCILMHTKSPFLTLLGLMQITLALPVAYSIYYFICGFSFFPFVNVNALFIVFALGADGECLQYNVLLCVIILTYYDSFVTFQMSLYLLINGRYIVVNSQIYQPIRWHLLSYLELYFPPSSRLSQLLLRSLLRQSVQFQVCLYSRSTAV